MTDLGFGFGRGKSKGNKDNLPVAASGPPPLSHRAGLVAEEMIQLENELAQSQQRAQEMENRAKVAESNLADMRQRVNQLQIERDDVVQELATVEGMVNSGAKVVLEILNRRKQEQQVESYRPKPERERAVAKALGMEGPEAPPPPAWLAEKRAEPKTRKHIEETPTQPED